MLNVLSQLIRLALAYVWLVLCSTKHKKEQETCRWICDCESHCGQAHLPHHLLNTSAITKTQNGSKNLLCQLGCA